jgi:hypothetical protein
MIMTILTPSEAKQARAAVELSQSKVAQATGISRTNLALFEVNKYLLDDAALTALKQFYQDTGHAFPDSYSVEQPESVTESPDDFPEHIGLRLVDGYAVPAGLSEDEAETILTEIHANDVGIESLSEQKSGVNWWSETPKTEGLNRLLALHARNYVLTRRLQGHELLNNTQILEDVLEEDMTNGMLLHKVISD